METSVTLLPTAPDGVRWTSVSLSVLDTGLTIERYEDLLRAAGVVKSASSFWIGDLIVFGEARYGERYAQALEATGLRYGTLANYARVCSRIGQRRRVEGLSFGHHDAVAKLEPPEQDRWLAAAAERSWTRDELRDAMRDSEVLIEPSAPPQLETSRARENLGAAQIVDAVRNAGEVKDVLRLTHQALEGATIVGLEEKIPGALRAAEEMAVTVAAFAERLASPSLVEISQRVVREATRSSGFAMVPVELFEKFVNAVSEESR